MFIPSRPSSSPENSSSYHWGIGMEKHGNEIEDRFYGYKSIDKEYGKWTYIVFNAISSNFKSVAWLLLLPYLFYFYRNY